MKQTAVDWLVEQIIDGTMPAREAIQQAKQMEQEYIMDAYWKIPLPEEKYYEKTFKSE